MTWSVAVSEGGVSPRAKCPPTGQNVPPASHAVVRGIFDRMATKEEEYDAVFCFLRPGYPAGVGSCSSWKKVPRFRKERERIIEVCHALPEGIYYSSCSYQTHIRR